jgi:hypothetical protein
MKSHGESETHSHASEKTILTFLLTMSLQNAGLEIRVEAKPVAAERGSLA